MSLLEINDLATYYHTDNGDVHAVDGVDLTVEADETLGLVGESGSGKSTLAKSINGMLPDNGEIVSGSIEYDGVDLTDIPENHLRAYRWRNISMIPQSSMNALDPVYTVGEQIAEVFNHHVDITPAEIKKKARELFDIVGIDPERLNDYPHQLSGGMKQRVMIAISLALDPDIVIADEPTTALDVIVQKQILDRLKAIQQQRSMAIILITHDISVVSYLCDNIAVFYGGRVVEYGDVDSVIRNPQHPYTVGLKNAFPSILSDDQELVSIGGNPPTLVEPSPGCRFADRCPLAVEECREGQPPTVSDGTGWRAECLRTNDVTERIYDETPIHEG